MKCSLRAVQRGVDKVRWHKCTSSEVISTWPLHGWPVSSSMIKIFWDNFTALKFNRTCRELTSIKVAYFSILSLSIRPTVIATRWRVHVNSKHRHILQLRWSGQLEDTLFDTNHFCRNVYQNSFHLQFKMPQKGKLLWQPAPRFCFQIPMQTLLTTLYFLPVFPYVLRLVWWWRGLSRQGW